MSVKTTNLIRYLLTAWLVFLLFGSLFTAARYGFQLLGLFVEKQTAQSSRMTENPLGKFILINR